jgi:hypothetical protein
MKLENKFAPVSLTIPIASNIEESLRLIPKATAKLRSSFGEIYATYAISFYTNMFMPYFLSNWFILRSTLPFTLAFSNTPGLLKPIDQGGKKSSKMQGYILSSGYCGLAFSCLSYCDYFKLSCVVDEAIMKNP